jgi:hypothetical protein
VGRDGGTGSPTPAAQGAGPLPSPDRALPPGLLLRSHLRSRPYGLGLRRVGGARLSGLPPLRDPGPRLRAAEGSAGPLRSGTARSSTTWLPTRFPLGVMTPSVQLDAWASSPMCLPMGDLLLGWVLPGSLTSQSVHPIRGSPTLLQGQRPDRSFSGHGRAAPMMPIPKATRWRTRVR